MTGKTTADFWRLFESLPEDVQSLARKKYQLWAVNPRHPSLHFKSVGKLLSVRITQQYRALGERHGEMVVWFWIGDHVAYERMIREG